MRPPEEENVERTKKWLSRACKQLRIAEGLLGQNPVSMDAIGNRAQRAVEYCLKAVLDWHQIGVPETDDIDQLLDLVSRVDSQLGVILRLMTVVATRNARNPVLSATLVRNVVCDRLGFDR
jgi:HEPN domain-containing protein